MEDPMSDDIREPEEIEEEQEAAFGGKLVPVSDSALKLPGVQEALARAQQREQVTMALLAYSISRTKSPDWVDMQGKPHPMTRAVVSMLKTVGITATITDVATIRRDDGHYIKRILGWAQQEGFPAVSVLGKAFSRDPFFMNRYAEDDDGNKIKTELPASEVQEDDVEAKAVTNFYYRCLCACLGIKGLTWADLAPFGIHRNEAAARITWGDNKPTETKPPAAGNGKPPACDRCGKPMRKRHGKDGDFYGCSGYPDCKNTKQIEAASVEPAAAAGPDGPPDAKVDALNSLLAFMQQNRHMGPTGVWNDMSAYLGRQVKSPADVTAEEIENYQQQQKELLASEGQ
jgi:hypothetical protein